MKFSKYFDHTLLKSDATPDDIRKLCEEAVKYDFASVCINGCYVSDAFHYLRGTDIKTATVVGFPLGAMASGAKSAEAKQALSDGASEIDMVINIGYAKCGRFEYIEREIAALSELCHSSHDSALLKVILETCLLTDDEIKEACAAAVKAGADYVKTSTGFSTGGASVHDISLMRQTVGNSAKIKASGGIRTYDDAVKFIEAGADRLGCSASVHIMEEYIKAGCPKF